MKIKIFAHNDYEKLETEVNNWLKDNYNILVKFVTQSEDEHSWTVIIWYSTWDNIE